MHTRKRCEGVLVQVHAAGMWFKQIDKFAYLRGDFCEDGGVGGDMNHRVQRVQDCFRRNSLIMYGRREPPLGSKIQSLKMGS